MDPVSRLGEGGRGRKRALQYAEAGVETGVRLLEVADEALLAAVLAGETCLRAGGADQEAALCTADRTFGLKRTDTSNLLLLLNGGAGSGGGGGCHPGCAGPAAPGDPGRSGYVGGSGGRHALARCCPGHAVGGAGNAAGAGTGARAAHRLCDLRGHASDLWYTPRLRFDARDDQCPALRRRCGPSSGHFGFGGRVRGVV